MTPDFPEATESGFRIARVLSTFGMMSIEYQFAGCEGSKVLHHDGKAILRGDSDAGERFQELPRPLGSDEQRRSVDAGQEDAPVPAGVQRPTPPRPADSPAAVLAQRRILDRFGESDLRQGDAGLVEETVAHGDRVARDGRGQAQREQGGEQRDGREHHCDDRGRKPLGLVVEDRAVHLASTSFIRAPMSAGEATTWIPPASRALIFSAAVPRPPAMIAPAWPIRRPGGAVCPAMKATTGFRKWPATKQAASSSAMPPISPIRTTASVPASSTNARRQSTKLVPLTGSPPMPMTVDCPSPSRVS